MPQEPNKSTVFRIDFDGPMAMTHDDDRAREISKANEKN